MVPHDEARAQLATFAAACEDERFGRSPTSPATGVIELSPRPEIGERAALYEEDIGRSLLFRREITAATVVWSLAEVDRGPAARAAVEVPDRALKAEMTVARVVNDAGGIQYDLTVAFVLGADFPTETITEFRGIRVSSNEVGRTASATHLGILRWSEIGPNAWRFRLFESELRGLAEAEVVELAVEYNYTNGDLILELGETGRAMFAEAMAAWGLAPAE